MNARLLVISALVAFAALCAHPIAAQVSADTPVTLSFSYAHVPSKDEPVAPVAARVNSSSLPTPRSIRNINATESSINLMADTESAQHVNVGVHVQPGSSASHANHTMLLSNHTSIHTSNTTFANGTRISTRTSHTNTTKALKGDKDDFDADLKKDAKKTTNTTKVIETKKVVTNTTMHSNKDHAAIENGAFVRSSSALVGLAAVALVFIL